VNPSRPSAQQAFSRAWRAFRQGDQRAARRWAALAARLDPTWAEPWLLLTAVATPRAAVAYATRAVELAPQDPRARQALRWALQRWRRQKKRPPVLPPSPEQLVRPTSPLFRWLGFALAALLLAVLWVGMRQVPGIAAMLPAQEAPPRLVVRGLAKATFTPTPTPTFTPTPTATPTPTFTPTPTATNTPTITPTPTKTSTPPPPPTPRPIVASGVPLPWGVGPNERWIDIDLSQQRLYAYQGTRLVRSFVVSTGVPAYPTVTGTYRIYVKYRYTDMSGPGYYLPNVPYTMYFYLGYGIHGTYWHNNFGTPMSHGCINMRTPDAEWLFYWASVGTVVNIHP